jgi:hypothetical protein
MRDIGAGLTDWSGSCQGAGDNGLCFALKVQIGGLLFIHSRGTQKFVGFLFRFGSGFAFFRNLTSAVVESLVGFGHSEYIGCTRRLDQ